MRRAVGAGVAEPDLAGPPPRVGDEVGPAPIRAVGAHGDEEEVAGEVDHRRPVAPRIVGHALHEGQAQRGQRDLRQRVPVGPDVSHVGRGQRRAGAGAVLDQHGLAQVARRGLGEGAHLHVGRAAGGEGDLDRHGALRGPSGLREAGRGKGGERREQRGAAGGHGGFLGFSAAKARGAL